MATTTHTGPIAIDQINTTFYVVGTGTLSTIQSAVDYVRTTLGYGRIVVTQGINVADDISAVTGGNVGIVIWDNRNGNDQLWYWEGTNYQPLDFVQDKGFVTYGMPQQIPATMLMGFDPTGGNGNGAGYITVIANPGLGMPALNLQADAQDGTPVLTFFKGSLDPAGIPRVQSPATLELYSDPTYPDNFNLWIGQANDFTGSKGMYTWPKPLEDAIDFQGQTIGGAYDQAIRLNPLGGDVMLGPSLTVSTDGDITTLGNLAVGNLSVTGDAIVGGELQADSAVFDSCTVANSPVRTFANTPDSEPSEGMVWPEIGIPVSLGSSWKSPSIDPATIPLLGANNVFTGSNTMPGITLTGEIHQTFSGTNASALESYSPNLGSGQIHYAFTAGRSNTLGNVFLAGFQDAGTGTATDNYGFVNIGAGPRYTFSMGGQFNAPSGIGVVGGGTKAFPAVQLDAVGTVGGVVNATRLAGINPTSTTTAQAMVLMGYSSNFSVDAQYLVCLHDPATGTWVSTNGNFGATGTVTAEGGLVVTGTGPTVANTLRLAAIGGTAYVDSHGPNPSTLGGFNFRVMSSDESQGINALALDSTGNAVVSHTVTCGNGHLRMGDRTAGGWTTGSANINADNLSLVLNAGAGGTLFLNNDQGTNIYLGPRAFVDQAGNGTFNGTLTAGTKSFRITHPLDDTQWLTHSSLEGPEVGVYYRGEAVVVDGEAEVTLPDYFEALTLPTERSVQLTQIFEGSPVFAQIAASRVTDGKFKIHANQPNTKVWWEVKAVRGDVAKLEVTTKKETTVNAQPATAATGTQRTRTPEAGKPKPEKVRA